MLENAKPGDHVVSHTRGRGMVEKVYNGGDYPVEVTFSDKIDYFTLDGKRYTFDPYPDIIKLIPKRWTPEGGKYLMGLDNNITACIYDSKIHPGWTTAGRMFKTGLQAKKAAFILGRIQRIVAYVVEQDYGETDLDYTIGFSPATGKWESTFIDNPPLPLAVIILMSHRTASSLSKLLNDNLI